MKRVDLIGPIIAIVFLLTFGSWGLISWSKCKQKACSSNNAPYYFNYSCVCLEKAK